MMLPPPDRETCVLYLLRHGATASNLAQPPVLQGNTIDLPLSPEGRRQAEATARLLADHALAAAYSSTLRRAVETAEIVAAPHGVAVTPLAELIEVDVGQWEGRSWEEIRRTDAAAYEAFAADAGRHGYLGGENLQQVADRATPALRRIAANHLGRRVLVVGHNVVNRALLAPLMGASLAHARTVAQANCGVNLLEYRHGAFHLVTLNAAFHLGPQ